MKAQKNLVGFGKFSPIPMARLHGIALINPQGGQMVRAYLQMQGSPGLSFGLKWGGFVVKTNLFPAIYIGKEGIAQVGKSLGFLVRLRPW